MRIRKKLIFLHTLFSVLMTLILLVTLRPVLLRVVARGEQQEAQAVLSLALMLDGVEQLADEGRIELDEGVTLRRGVDPRSVPDAWVELARQSAGQAVGVPDRELSGIAVAWASIGDGEGLWVVETSLASARRAVLWVYGYTIAALLVVYALVALALELLVLPRHVYDPLANILLADRALREGRVEEELVPEYLMPADELGEIMRSRNETIRTIRRHEAALGDALKRIELVATDLKRKNHLLESARRNLADADRLVSLGMMAAGVAHELNTPLAVAKGLAEKLDGNPVRGLSEAEAALLRRVIGRLERVSESLLDFARVRPPAYATSSLREIVDEAVTLIRLDRHATRVQIDNRVPAELTLEADADRMVQVLVNILRNALDAMARADRGNSVIIEASHAERDGDEWVTLRIVDDGPGIDPALLPTLFEPFVSSRLDDRGTGLGLAVSEGIVREHGGTILVTNRVGCSGAVFEVMLPRWAGRTLSQSAEEGVGDA